MNPFSVCIFLLWLISVPAFADRTVTEFGAVPDDLLDDTAAIRQAIAAMPAGGVLLFPAGEYRVSAVEIPAGLIFRGEGPNSISQQTAGIRKGTVLIASPGGSTAIELAPGDNVNGLENLSVYLDAASDTGTLVSVSGSARLANVEIAGLLRSQGTGLVFRNAARSQLIDVSAGFRLRFGVVIENSPDLRISGGQISGWDIALTIRNQENKKEYLSFNGTAFHRPFDPDAAVYPAPEGQTLTGMGNQPSHYLVLIDLRRGQHIHWQNCRFSGEEPDEEQRPELPPGIITNAIVVGESVREAVIRECTWENVYLKDASRRADVFPGPVTTH